MLKVNNSPELHKQFINMDEGHNNSSQSSSSSSLSMSSTHVEFFTDFDNGTSGKLKGVAGNRERRCDFAIELTTLVEAGDLTGYYAEVTRELDQQRRVCFFTADSISQRGQFIAQLNKSFGAGGGFTCSFSDQELIKFVQFLKRSQALQIEIKKATTLVGLQPKSSYWVLGEDKYFDESGCVVGKETSRYIWSFETLSARCDKVSPNELIPELSTEVETKCLSQLINFLRTNMRHNFLSSLLVVGGSIMGCHFRKIVDLFGGFSVLVAFGPTETGKSTSLRAALSLSGGQKAAFYSKGSTPYMMERAALSCLPFAIDDPNMATYAGRKQLDIGELVVDLYNGAKTANLRSGALLPCSAPIIGTNTLLKDDPRTQSRTLNVEFRGPTISARNSNEQKARADFEEALRKRTFSSALGWVISLGVKMEREVSIIRKFNMDLLKEPLFAERPRQTCGWSILYYFTLQLLQEGLEEDQFNSARDDLKEYIVSMVHGSITSKQAQSDGVVSEVVVSETIEDIISVLSDKPIYEVLAVIRTGCKVGGQEVVAFCPEGVCGLRHSLGTIKTAVNKSKQGKCGEVKDFLDPSKKEQAIVRGVNSVRRRCITINISSLSTALQQQLWERTGSKIAPTQTPQSPTPTRSRSPSRTRNRSPTPTRSRSSSQTHSRCPTQTLSRSPPPKRSRTCHHSPTTVNSLPPRRSRPHKDGQKQGDAQLKRATRSTLRLDNWSKQMCPDFPLKE